ncbi:MAG: tRNA (adenosine(37)-N6)-dimethylallyltransferase MiaA [Spirochaetales bacterium]|nr:tRNA (adenosine(37)-N6)-dimethylallyltransferase MiaA [Spirochaetales bacterium]MCF7937126.1 tRNA (adenosine(37)-N6)-dimethylallyltransferase MiaA [Spirochaetales bacterium]
MNTESKTELGSVQRVLVLFGPTAVGKTEFLLRCFAGRSGPQAEIINADSMQIYRGLHIGTAQPDRVTLERLPHHLVDQKDPASQYTVGEFIRLADDAVQKVSRRGHLPVVSGGTAYYIKHFLFGAPRTPPGDKDIRRRLIERMNKGGLDSLRAELEEKDPLSSERIGKNDGYRIVRALEVLYTSGRPLSGFRVPDTLRESYSFFVAGLYREREELYQRINRRVDRMFDLGLREEAAALMEKGYHLGDPAMQAIGYREFFDMKRFGCPTLADVRRQIQLHSRRYAKRQLSFFRSLPGVRWYRPEESQRFLEELASQWGKKGFDSLF